MTLMTDEDRNPTLDEEEEMYIESLIDAAEQEPPSDND